MRTTQAIITAAALLTLLSCAKSDTTPQTTDALSSGGSAIKPSGFVSQEGDQQWFTAIAKADREDAVPLVAQLRGNRALPSWEPHIKPVGFVSPEGAKQWLKAIPKEQRADAGDYYDILGVGCSWYCGGEAYNVTASSTPPDEGANAYVANNAHDLRYDTAWIEGVDGPGIGETLTYTFTNKCPRLNKILIHTGYIKDEITWIKYNRVRTLKLSINGEPTALLRLTDTRAQQSFELNDLGPGPLGRHADGEDLVLTFKILDIYPGTTNDNTAITEIYFDGLDVH